MRRDLLVAGLLAAGVLAVYGQVWQHEFIQLDDNLYVSANSRVQQGLTWSGAAWAFTTAAACNWHPLTWLSHMLDCQLFGGEAEKAGWHHMTSVLLHILNSVLLYVVLARLTGAPWRSAMAAALFALHPLHVESVAWVSERKDVLSTLFWMLTLAAYTWYAARPAWYRYAAVVVCLALGLLAKPMLVSLPLVLLVVDWWPLGRFRVRRAWRLVLEKAPLALLAAASAAITLHVQQGAMRASQGIPLGIRLQNAAVSYVAYLWQMVWPARLAAFYPYPPQIPAWRWAGATALLAGLTVLAIWFGRRRRYLAAGWLWYLVTLVPVIGVVQVGSQAMADRFTYVPLIGIFVAVIWGAADAAARWRGGRIGLAAAAAAILAACMAATYVQAGFWRDTQTLFEHALRVTEGNFVAHAKIAGALARRGQLAEATAHYRDALSLNPWNAEAHNGLGLVLVRQGQPQAAVEEFHRALAWEPDEPLILSNLGNALFLLGRLSEAAPYYRKALERDPQCANAHIGLGCVLLESGQLDAAEAELREAMRLVPESAEPYYNLGNVRTSQGRTGEAIGLYQEALRRQPDDVIARTNLANVLFGLGRRDEAAAHYREVLRVRPDFLAALTGLVWVLATDPAATPAVADEAVRLGGRAVALTGRRDASALDALGGAYAQSGRFAEAAAAAEEAAAMAASKGNAQLAAAIRARLAAYRAGRPCRVPAAAAGAAGPARQGDAAARPAVTP
ncbi:MAG: tetratricopeptide repeat protein [Planctomycetes bacterium]|nr:tetratricopeptide repeat protein [Planctomycetota bacterium]